MTSLFGSSAQWRIQASNARPACLSLAASIRWHAETEINGLARNPPHGCATGGPPCAEAKKVFAASPREEAEGIGLQAVRVRSQYDEGRHWEARDGRGGRDESMLMPMMLWMMMLTVNCLNCVREYRYIDALWKAHGGSCGLVLMMHQILVLVLDPFPYPHLSSD
ncbi:hypothetical protein BBK36DRAFT_1139700 [Trichoderma citrinoviride]|uniref:Uncharacterized protein n=1 Tax=Trichoderma citrinoviride TaxID=58853 RepID=A0A2T4BFZ5_9HYPO|nr:hypothetical protein BBK36DRAFT_1139700 [Trichoderma citrinoviride]PTB68198.1 hypothetical protein BBK36DRAFT_1139700 [Trichoderma citrinoviride]